MKNKLYIAYFLLTLLVVNTLRTLQLLFLIDPTTGFYTSGTNLGVVFTYIILAFSIVCGLLSIISKNIAVRLPAPSFEFGIIQIFFGISLAVEPFFSVKLPETVSKPLAFVRITLIVASGLIFIFFGISNFLGKKPKYKYFVVPVICYLIRLIVTFVCYTGMSNTTNSNYEILMLSCATVFFLSHGKLLSSIDNPRLRIITMLFAVLTALSASLCSVPQIMLFILKKSSDIHLSVNGIASNLFLFFYSLSYLFCRESRSTRKYNKSKQ